ncbi:MAG: AraC family transcriptional regulator [Sneathiella sp.]|uniref:AraC family transcriptional regulator n=1 Tax=Sneathiella sp. TaxID=1964365 RepID=UPI0030025ECA
MSFEHVFSELEIEADPFALCELRGRCDLGLGRQSFATLHYILGGHGEIVFRGLPPVEIKRGTLVLVPALQSHILRSFGDNQRPLPDCHPAELDLAHHLHEGEDHLPSNKLLAVCSQVNVGLRGISNLIDLVREPIVEYVEPLSPMADSLDQLLRELSAPKLGSRAMIEVLLKQCMILLLRNRLESQDKRLDWMAALNDEKLWGALRLMLDMPGNLHSVESLAEAAGMSRSTFAKRFFTAYGKGPMELLRNLRMHRAASLLATSDLPVKRIAELVGFHSRSAFTRKFEGIVGTSPGKYRSQVRGD